MILQDQPKGAVGWIVSVETQQQAIDSRWDDGILREPPPEIECGQDRAGPQS